MRFNLVAFFQDNPRVAFNLLYPQAALKNAGHTCTAYILFRNNRIKYHYASQILLTEEEIDLMVENLKDSDAVGISVYYPFLEAARQLTGRIQSRLKVPVVWGGNFPTLEPETCIAHTDMLCIGEAEETIVELAAALSSGKDTHRIQSVWSKTAGSIIRNGLRPAPADLDALIPLEFPLSDCRYVGCEGKTNRYTDDRLYYIMASRGCRFSCSYCGEAALRKACDQRHNYRVRSPENIIGELEKAKKDPSIKYVIFFDALFPFDTAWIRTFSALYKKQIGLPFATRLHPGLIKKETVELLKDAGLRFSFASLESGSENIRRTVFNRQVSDDQFLSGHRLLSEHDVRVSYTILVDNPWETRQEKDRALDLLMKIGGKFTLEMCTLVFFPKHAITTRALEEGAINAYHLSWAKKPRSSYLEIFYRRGREEMHWICTLLLLAIHARLPWFPKKTVTSFYASKIMRRWPQPAFYFLYHAHEFLYLAASGRKIVVRLLLSEQEAWSMRIGKLFIPRREKCRSNTGRNGQPDIAASR